MFDLVDEQLAEVFAGLARQLHAQETPEETNGRLTQAAVATIDGCDHAAISLLLNGGHIRTQAATDSVPQTVDDIQYRTGQGPCLDALQGRRSVLIDDLFVDERWPAFSRSAAEQTGVRSMMSFQLFVDDDSLGALNLYSRRSHAFDSRARAIGVILAAHGAIALDAAREHARREGLDRALLSSREIGISIGVIMTRAHVTKETAFDLLVKASQQRNAKLRDVAAEVVETGEIPRH